MPRLMDTQNLCRCVQCRSNGLYLEQVQRPSMISISIPPPTLRRCQIGIDLMKLINVLMKSLISPNIDLGIFRTISSAYRHLSYVW